MEIALNQPTGDSSFVDGNEMPAVSVVIPSYNSAKYVRHCLTALRAQKTTRPFEVILVDSSEDGADRIVATEFPEVRLVHLEGRRSVGTGRNIGVRMARGDVVLFIDTDCIASPTWVEDLSASIRSYDADGGGGSVSNGTPLSITGSVMFYLEFFRILEHRGEPRETPYLMGGNCGFRKDVFRTSRYADESVGDDFSFNWQQLVRGRRLLFFPSVNVRHLNKTGVRQVLSYQYKLGRGAYSYRDDLNLTPRIMRVLTRLPFLVAMMPAGVMLWVGGTVLRKRGIVEFLKFTALLPFMLVANGVWTLGFRRELLERKRRAKPAQRRETQPGAGAIQDVGAE